MFTQDPEPGLVHLPEVTKPKNRLDDDLAKVHAKKFFNSKSKLAQIHIIRDLKPDDPGSDPDNDDVVFQADEQPLDKVEQNDDEDAD